MKSGAHGIENGQSKLVIIPIKRSRNNRATISGRNNTAVNGRVIGN
jgi:hypothetical protein